MDEPGLQKAIKRLTPRQRQLALRMIDSLSIPVATYANPDSDIATQSFVDSMGDVLCMHAATSSESFTKDKFEHAMKALLEDDGHPAELSPRNHPGADIAVDGVPWSFKTQADRSIKPDRVHISKFMELGRGEWQTEEHLAGLRDRMIAHMSGYERILDLRCLSAASARAGSGEHEYELIEIPKTLLLRVQDQPCSMHMTSRQKPKPGDCRVYDDRGLAFELYFDGGTERKLQVRKLRIDLCIVHARWRFGSSTSQLSITTAHGSTIGF